MEILEWWPDYGRHPLWRRTGPGGVEVDAVELGIPPGLTARLAKWSDAYSDDKLPLDTAGDRAWLDIGIGLLAEVRSALDGRYAVVVTEPWWGETVLPDRI